jgi:hypothetical protein
LRGSLVSTAQTRPKHALSPEDPGGQNKTSLNVLVETPIIDRNLGFLICHGVAPGTALAAKKICAQQHHDP